MAVHEARERLAKGREPLHFNWMMLPGELQAGVMARTGFGATLIDMQHGQIGFRDMGRMVAAINRAGKPAFVRVPLGGWGMVNQAIDTGAAAVVCPMVNNAGDARQLVAAAKFPPVGQRSWGPYLAIAAAGLDPADYFARANSLSMTFAMIETREAVDNLSAICAVEGIDGIFVGPNDLSISLSDGEVRNADHGPMQKTLTEIAAGADEAGVVPGIYATTPEQAKAYAAMGYRFISIGTDMAFLAAGAAAALAGLT